MEKATVKATQDTEQMEDVNKENLRPQFVIFKPLSYYFEVTVRSDVKVSFARRPMSCLPVDIKKELKKGYSVPQDFNGLKVTNWLVQEMEKLKSKLKKKCKI